MSKKVLDFTKNINELVQKNLALPSTLENICALVADHVEVVDAADFDSNGRLQTGKEETSFSLDELCIVEIANLAGSLMISHSKNQEDAEESRKLNIVKSALGTLSYSELDAVIHIFKELNSSEGLLVASKVADRVGITRSVIVNALRKFESAGVIETRSLGMKGTYIKVLNDSLLTELNKLNG